MRQKKLSTKKALIGILSTAILLSSMPVTGIPMPFISYGGTSMVFIMAAMGILLNISKVSKSLEKNELA